MLLKVQKINYLYYHFFYVIIRANIPNIAIILDLITDGVNPVINIRIINISMHIIFIFIFDIFILLSIEIIPIKIIPTCVPDTANI